MDQELIEQIAAKNNFRALFHTGIYACTRDTDGDTDAGALISCTITLMPNREYTGFIKDVLTGNGTLKERCLHAVKYYYSGSTWPIFRAGLEMVTDNQWERLEEWIMDYPDDNRDSRIAQ